MLELERRGRTAGRWPRYSLYLGNRFLGFVLRRRRGWEGRRPSGGLHGGLVLSTREAAELHVLSRARLEIPELAGPA